MHILKLYFLSLKYEYMWRWPVVQARKVAVNNAKGKVFSLHAKLISLAAQKWANPDDNPSLAQAIFNAKKAGVPNENIARSIKKWSGEDSDSNQIQEVVYEGYAPGGIALIISCITDNKNRTVSNIRHIFWKYGWNLWESWVVSWMFHKKWIFFLESSKYTFDEIELLALEMDIEDVKEELWYIKIITSLEAFHDIELSLWEKNIEIYESKVDYIPENETELEDFEKVLKFTKMMQAFDEDDDVNFVSSNEIISETLQEEVDAFIEKNTFRT